METYKKKYKDLVKRLNKAREEKGVYTFNSVLDAVAPELGESKNERIRKALIEEFKKKLERGFEWKEGIPNNAVISWLEKQGESVKVPKFKVGDWLVHKDMVGVLCCITQIHAPHYYLTNNNSFIKFGEEDNYRPWTIQDAKDGDVLVCESGWTCIFKTLVNDETFSSYCFMDNTKWFCETGSEAHTLNKEFMKAYNGEIKPATQEQRDLLFKKMKEAGYEWDAEKKELKKIEQKPVKVPKFKVGDFIQFNGMGHTRYTIKEVCGLSHYINTCNKRMDMSYTDANFELVEQKPAEWSEEDENHVKSILSTIECCKAQFPNAQAVVEAYNADIDWFKSLKDRVQPQPKQEWSEEDEKTIHLACEFIRHHSNRNDSINGIDCPILIERLKSLRPQSHWKPSKEQLDALRIAIGDEQGSDCCDILRSLLKDLKSL